MSSLALQIALLAAVAVALLVAMALGWSRRGRRTSAVVPVLPGRPAALGALRLSVPATYVSTTLGGDWLERVVAHGLGTRSRAVVEVHDAGVVITRTGAPEVVVPADALRAAERAPGMAGKYVGGDGLVVLRWEVPGADGETVPLATGLRTDHSADRPRLVEALQALLGGAGTPDPRTEEHA